MRTRCENENHPTYCGYGAHGIKVCDDWAKPDGEGFVNFCKWSTDNGYEEGLRLSIDRIDPDGDYTPENCRWVTISENSSRARHETKKETKKEDEEDAEDGI